MDIITLLSEKKFIGSEFLTWLWYKSETSNGVLPVVFMDKQGNNTTEKVEVWFDDRLTLAAEYGQSLENVLKGNAPSTSIEAKTALMEGKKVLGAKLRLVRGIMEWVFTIKAETLDLHSLKMPDPVGEEETFFYDRIDLIEQLDQILMALFSRFLQIRLGSTWAEEELPSIRQWVFSDAASLEAE